MNEAFPNSSLPNILFKQVVENNWIGVVLTDLEGRILFSNKSAQNLYGYSLEEMKGNKASMFNANPNYDLTEIIQTAIEKGVWHGQSLQKKKNGETLLVALSIWVVYGENNSPVAFVSNARDVTEIAEKEKKLEQALLSLERKEAQLSAIINNNDSLIYSINKDYELIEFNTAFVERMENLVKRTPQRGENIFEYLFPRDHEDFKKAYNIAFKGEKIETIVDIPHIGLGEGYSVEQKINPIYEKNQVVAISVMVVDITVIRSSEKRLQKAHDEKEFLLHEIHHRVKNNLAIVSSLLKLEELNSTSPEIANVLISSQNRIKSTALVHQFLYQNNTIDKVDFKKYVKEYTSQIETLISRNQNTTVEVTGEDLPLDITKATPCGLIINEWFTNSIKHAFDQSIIAPSILIHISTNEGNVIVRYQDNGIGYDHTDGNKEKLGMTIINTLTKQLKGKLHYLHQNGMAVELCFPMEAPQKK